MRFLSIVFWGFVEVVAFLVWIVSETIAEIADKVYAKALWKSLDRYEDEAHL